MEEHAISGRMEHFAAQVADPIWSDHLSVYEDILHMCIVLKSSSLLALSLTRQNVVKWQ